MTPFLSLDDTNLSTTRKSIIAYFIIGSLIYFFNISLPESGELWGFKISPQVKNPENIIFLSIILAQLFLLLRVVISYDHERFRIEHDWSEDAILSKDNLVKKVVELRDSIEKMIEIENPHEKIVTITKRHQEVNDNLLSSISDAKQSLEQFKVGDNEKDLVGAYDFFKENTNKIALATETLQKLRTKSDTLYDLRDTFRNISGKEENPQTILNIRRELDNLDAIEPEVNWGDIRKIFQHGAPTTSNASLEEALNAIHSLYKSQLHFINEQNNRFDVFMKENKRRENDFTIWLNWCRGNYREVFEKSELTEILSSSAEDLNRARDNRILNFNIFDFWAPVFLSGLSILTSILGISDIQIDAARSYPQHDVSSPLNTNSGK